MTRDTLEATTAALFEEVLYQCKQQKPVQAGFWAQHDDGDPKFFQLGSLTPLLNSGSGKDFLFAVMRHWIEALRADAVYIYTESWQFTPNAKAATLEGGWEKHIDTGFKWLVENDYGVVVQCIFIIGMTKDWACLATRKFEDVVMNGERKLVFHGDRTLNTMPIEQYGGRTKMFGKITEPEVEEIYNKIAPQVAEYIAKI